MQSPLYRQAVAVFYLGIGELLIVSAAIPGCSVGIYDIVRRRITNWGGWSVQW